MPENNDRLVAGGQNGGLLAELSALIDQKQQRQNSALLSSVGC
jgi:hypothetical protein